MDKLAVLTGSSQGTVYILTDEVHTVGRADENSIVLDDGGISRHHAMVALEGDHYKIRDLNSANGTFVNGRRALEAVLQEGDVVRLGSVELRYETTPDQPRPKQVTIPGTVRPSVAGAAPAGKASLLVPVATVGGPALKPGRAPRLWLWALATTLACWVVGGLALWWLGIIPPRSVRVSLPDGPPPAVAGNLTPKTYEDPKGRFSCRVPGGWQLIDEPADARSNVRFVSGADEIRVISQSTAEGPLDDADATAAGEVFGQLLTKAEAAGRTGRILGTAWRTVEGTRALQVELEMDPPNYLWMRQVKHRTRGVDHTIALYVETAARRGQLVVVFDEFLQGFATTAPSAPAAAP